MKLKTRNFKKKIQIIINLLLVVSFMFQTTSVFAQQLSLSISPPLLEVTIKPGKSVLIAYTVGNYGDPAALKARVLPFRTKDNKGNIVIENDFSGPVRFSLDNADIQMDQPFFARSRETRQLLLRIRIPEGAPDGDYYYSLLVESQPAPGSEGTTSSQAQGTIGSNILVTVTESGRVEIKGRVARFEAMGGLTLNFFGKKIKVFDSADKIPVLLELANEGKNAIKPDGEIILKGNFGEEAKYSVLQQNVLAGSTRILTATPSADLKRPMKEQASLVLAGFFLGKYQLSVNLGFGEGAPSIFSQTSFIAFPFKFIAGFVVAILLTTYIVKKLKK